MQLCLSLSLSLFCLILVPVLTFDACTSFGVIFGVLVTLNYSVIYFL